METITIRLTFRQIAFLRSLLRATQHDRPDCRTSIQEIIDIIDDAQTTAALII